MSHRFRLRNVEYNKDVQHVPKYYDHATYVQEYFGLRVNPGCFTIFREKSVAQTVKNEVEQWRVERG